MNRIRIFITGATAVVLAAGAAFADDGNSGKKDQKSDTLRKADAIFNEIMLSLPKDMKARIDSARTILNKKEVAGAADSVKHADKPDNTTQEQKGKPPEELPYELRQQIENAIREMDKRQNERVIELKEMKKRN
jgi:hypothetical protein